MKILLVDDDEMIGVAVVQALQDASYAVDWVRDGQSALEAVLTEFYDLLLLDIGLPEFDGLEVLKQLRTTGSAIPVIILTGRNGVEDRIDGLDLGADDYLVKPFEARELLARMRAIFRRHIGSTNPVLTNGPLSLNLATFEVTYNGQIIRLTARQFSLLQALMVRPGTILSRGDLERHIYGWNDEVESNAIEFLIHAIRKKIGSAAIRNVRGVGWMVDRST